MNYKQNDYTKVFAQRAERLRRLREDPRLLAAAKIHYKDNPWDFIRDWGMTFDPRKLETGGLANIPFIPWPRQVEYLQWLWSRWKSAERGLVEKSRDFGVTWLSVAFAGSLWCFHDGVAIGFGSRKEVLVDKLGDPDCIFEKLRHFINHIPSELLPEGYSSKDHNTYMRLVSPKTGASITGEAGDNIGRGGRKSIYIVDEAAFIEHQEKVDAALSQATNCQIDISTFNGNGNLFYRKQQRFLNTPRHFICDWRDDPRKDQTWYDKQKAEQPEEIVAQEIDRDPNASNTNSFIPARWVVACIDAHLALGFDAEGVRTLGFDPADTGDARACVMRYGSVMTGCEQLKAGDITTALPWSYELADIHRADLFIYDGDGMGAPVIKVDIRRRSAHRFQMVEYRGSGEIKDKDGPSVKGDNLSKRNVDCYANFKAQSWTWLRERFRKTYEAIRDKEDGKLLNIDPDTLISLSSKAKDLRTLQAELSRPRREFTENGKIKVESKKAMKARQVESPNLAEALVMAFAESKLKDRNAVNSFEPEYVG